MSRFPAVFLLALLLPLSGNGDTGDDRLLRDRIAAHIGFLADDLLRETIRSLADKKRFR